ncbi:hypothetical protein [Nocardioides sp. CER19]|uniref:hypothetical protein n=1 Tax=Nocardioides sp. CER19 TaxID=3038538 RepID=UPI00244C9C46|nr:hypothetical protein [Nocardioides sp. CER19]MDH2415604.1 hypothetical protein [Nocardioides sp. CER19]
MPLKTLRAATWRHPRPVLAAKAAVAAGAAWLVVQPLGGFVDDYPYYAPLGAVVAMSTSVVESARSAAQAVAAIVTGAALAFGVDALPLPGAAAVAAGIGLGVIVAGARFFGTMGSWVPFATLFVLIVGGAHPMGYAVAYGGLTALGAAIGVVVNLALPQLPLTPAAMAQERLRGQLADQLDLLADGLASEDVLSRDDWARLRLALEPDVRRAEDLLRAATESRRANWRARRWAEVADRREEQARALQRLTGCIDEVIALVVDVRTSMHADDLVAAQLRERATAAFRAVAEMLRTVDGEPEDPDGPDAPAAASTRAAGAVARLAEDAGRAGAAAGHRYLAAAAIAVTLHQAVEAWS